MDKVIIKTILNFHNQGETILAAQYLVKKYELGHTNFKQFAFREAADISYILMTAEGILGEPQTVRIPENVFEFSLSLIINLLAHEMLHVRQKDKSSLITDKNEREWQAYYEMLFHKIFPLVPNVSDFYKNFFGLKAIEYYDRMGKNSALQIRYASQKLEVEAMICKLKD